MRKKPGVFRRSVGLAAIILTGIFISAYAFGIYGDTLLLLGLFEIAILIAVIEAGALSRLTYHSLFVPRPRDSSEIHRVIIEPTSGEEIIVSGSPKSLYRDACLEYWDFKRIGKQDNWILVDERDNEITDNTLESYQSIARIVFVEGSGTHRESAYDQIEESKDDSSKSQYGVTFYD